MKCDEVRPACGTCYRRGYVCQGYATPQTLQTSQITPASDKVDARNELSRRQFERLRRTGYNVTDRQASVDPHRASGSDSDPETPSSVSLDSVNRTNTVSTVVHCPKAPLPIADKKRLETIGSSPKLYQKIPFFPAGTIPSADEPILQLFFARHPADQVISADFVDEINENVLKVFMKDPAAVTDSLSAIGHVY